MADMLFCEKKKALFDLELPPRKLLQRPGLTVLLPEEVEEDDEEEDHTGEGESESAAVDEEVDVYSSDEFRMYEFKVRRCMRGRSHDWTDCPFAHPGEKARRRDPRRYHYSGAACPDFRRAGSCPRGDACDLAHGVFECWLHPARYRTIPCKDGRRCRRKVCFFAHFPWQLRLLPSHGNNDEKACYSLWSASDHSSSAGASAFSPTSTLVSFSPPISPSVGEMQLSRHNGKKQKNITFLDRHSNKTSFVMDYECVCEEYLMNSLNAMELSLSPVTSSAAGVAIRELGEEQKKRTTGISRSSSMCWPDLDWVNELLM